MKSKKTKEGNPDCGKGLDLGPTKRKILRQKEEGEGETSVGENQDLRKRFKGRKRTKI